MFSDLDNLGIGKNLSKWVKCRKHFKMYFDGTELKSAVSNTGYS